MKVVQFGAGNIGRGFLGQLYWQSAFEIVYVDVDEELVDRLNQRRSYPLRLVDSDGRAEEMVIDRLRAVSARDREAVARELSDADLAATSVGHENLADTAQSFAAGLAERARRAAAPLNILLCENLRHSSEHMNSHLQPRLSPKAAGYAKDNLGLIEMVVGRMVPNPTDALRAEDPLLIVAEPAAQLEADKDAFKGPIPQLSGMQPVSPIDAYFVRKLFTLNTAHAALAYLGYPRYEYIWQCAQDRDIHEMMASVLDESCRGLIAEYGFDRGELIAYSSDLMRRFANKALGDTVARVAADPLRKLRPEDRLVGPAQLCEKHGITPTALAGVIGKALSYDNPGDRKAQQMQEIVRQKGR
ncbi:MAG TPA: hypothetical protein VE986_02955, partial [Hyphomicrobiales bacterium]|nr:hypothetical protein [Hyphomicrobiales bacterium]